MGTWLIRSLKICTAGRARSRAGTSQPCSLTQFKNACELFTCRARQGADMRAPPSSPMNALEMPLPDQQTRGSSRRFFTRAARAKCSPICTGGSRSTTVPRCPGKPGQDTRFAVGVRLVADAKQYLPHGRKPVARFFLARTHI